MRESAIALSQDAIAAQESAIAEPFVSMFKEMFGHDDPDIFLWHLLARYEKEIS